MRLLGIDYGRKKIGLAISTEGKLATPLKVLRVASAKNAIKEIGNILASKKIENVVLGISEGKTAKETRKFARRLEKQLGTKVIFHDETFTTKKAQRLSIEAGIQRKKRKGMEDAYSATLILQNYLDGL